MTTTSAPEMHITPNTPLLPAIQSWEIYLYDQNRSLYTVKAFLGDLRLFAGFLPPDKTVGSVSTDDIQHFLDWLQTGRSIPCSPKSLARRITSVKSFFRWLFKMGRISLDPAEKILQQSVISPLPTILTAAEQEKVIKVANSYRQAKKPDARPYTLLALLLETGIKKGECLSLKRNHLDFERPDARILFVRYTSAASRYKERKIELSNSWVECYNEYVEQYHPLDRVFPWSPRRLEYLLEDIGEEAGLTKHLSFDMCRWTCALNDWLDGMEADAIRQKMGVSKIQWREVSLKLKQLSGDNVPLNSQP